MKKTKRFIALLLALVLMMSGVLSGVPGGGIARAEEAETEVDDISASLSRPGGQTP